MIQIQNLADSQGNRFRLRSLAESKSAGNYEWSTKWPDHELRDPVAADLLEIGKAIHLADRGLRRSLRLGQRTRTIYVRVPVTYPRLWNQQKQLLEDLAFFASRDLWNIEFESRQAFARIRTDRAKDPNVPGSVVALFSGGLDSLCGTAYLASQSERPVFVGHSPPGRENNLSIIQRAWRDLGREPFPSKALVTFRLEVRERNKMGRRSMFQEPTRRTRPFFFLSLACAVALDAKIPAVQMSENGALGLSLPIRADSYDAMCTRQAHPHLLNGFSQLLDRLAPRRRGWRVYNPFEEMTKGEACMLLGKAGHLAGKTRSCEYVGRQAAFLKAWKKTHTSLSNRIGDGPQCGLCVPCLIRRAALLRASIPDPTSGYFFDACRVHDWDDSRPRPYLKSRARITPPLYASAAPHVYYMRRFCKGVLNMGQLDFAVQYIPELRTLFEPQSVTIIEIRNHHNLMKRLAKEMFAFLDSAS